MNHSQIVSMIFFILISLAVIMLPVIVIYARKKTQNNKILFSIYVLIWVWIARFTISLFGGLSIENNLTVVETVFDSFIHALQTFSMDEDYTLYISAGKIYFENNGLPGLAAIYGIVISILNVCAPVLGGALVLDILACTFPLLRIKMNPFTPKIVFSELSNEAITLAEDIIKDDHYKIIMGTQKKPLIIFTDAYDDPQTEATIEMFERAKAINAICIRTDLLKLPLQFSKCVDYFLLDHEMIANVTALSELLKNDHSGKKLWPESNNEEMPVTRIFCFANDDHDHLLIRNICNKEKEQVKKVIVRGIREYRNAIINQIYDVPLFLPLINQANEKEKELTITLFGDGIVLEEAFRTIYWSGQIYNTKLNVNVVGKHASEFKNMLQEKYSELMESCKAESKILNISPFRSEKNPPYIQKLRFIDLEEIQNLHLCPKDILINTDYFLLLSGDDSENMKLAESLKIYIQRNHYEMNQLKNVVIAPLIADDIIAESICRFNPEPMETYITPFGTIKSRYNCKNIYMDNFIDKALKTENLYNKQHQMKIQNDEYTYWANIARTIHAPYKLFMLGMLKSINLEDTSSNRFEVDHAYQVTPMQEHEIAWMEHRRWNSFIRSQGFICPTTTQYENFYEKTKLHKNIELKLHPCLVESQLIPEKMPDDSNYDVTKYDYLDYVTMKACELEAKEKNTSVTQKELIEKDYKQWDYRKYDSYLMSFFS